MSDYNLGICKIIFSPWFSVYREYVIIVDYLYKFSKQLLVLLCKTAKADSRYECDVGHTAETESNGEITQMLFYY